MSHVSLLDSRAYIGGKWLPAESGTTIPVLGKSPFKSSLPFLRANTFLNIYRSRRQCGRIPRRESH
ncbi:hypothetical protein V8C42DRAFT_311953 [Trichoderma barbatum]